MHLFNGGLRAALLALYLTLTVALAAIPSSKRFDLSKPSYNLFRSKSLHENSAQQSFAFDNINRRLFVAQLRDGTGATSGDLCITQLDFSGKYLGHMHLNGFGHGVSFGAQGTRDGATYLWTEVEANGNGYGKRLARFKWKHGNTLSASAAALTKFTPIAGATERAHGIHRPAGQPAGRPLSAQGRQFKSKVFQGYAAHGSYLYIMTGTSYEASDGEVNSQVASIDMNTGKIVQGPTLTNAGSSLLFREPEGMGVYKTKAGEVRFFLGFATGKRGDRRSSLFYKDALI
ncbi:teichoic acid biosynthesis protein C [Blastomyces dermatitidis ATCC 18188]|uniref:Teichoic acid biosynthesis protein C n=1 Tax=Ajellomyces dermatitidis (strain ATCC 18188 / CBS 674.68) TaxID=653446 RepID=F2TIW4_AJEDA|nr:teichoic acid biosynthesis protein C [Blastomyces dermatitidis ATCC 18188]